MAAPGHLECFQRWEQSHSLTILPSIPVSSPHRCLSVPHSGLGCQALVLSLGFPCEWNSFISEGSALVRRTDMEGVVEAPRRVRGAGEWTGCACGRKVLPGSELVCLLSGLSCVLALFSLFV